ncbi:helix-turn-helix domain-containing protein [Natrononativus amylolyticus]|uniref:helix-turn-helix domain-containing protein n=1 Tax=Natrononativus amylolyticus TaxID=2963434 RepID=UPI0031F31AE0
MIELGEIVTETPDEIVEALRAHPSIIRFELLESADRRVLTKYEMTDTELYDFVEASSSIVEFPVVAQDGWFEFELTGTREDLERLRATLDAEGAAYELQSLVGTTDADVLLTDRQRELLEIAVRSGYFEVPRKCTLAELAATVGIDKATASTVLRRGEAKIVKWFLSGPGMKGNVP